MAYGFFFLAAGFLAGFLAAFTVGLATGFLVFWLATVCWWNQMNTLVRLKSTKSQNLHDDDYHFIASIWWVHTAAGDTTAFSSVWIKLKHCSYCSLSPPTAHCVSYLCTNAFKNSIAASFSFFIMFFISRVCKDIQVHEQSRDNIFR